ncbi:hypothetical protein QYE76_060850 [Lolium multiflorum]|uniref:F-box domain-containing protein n=1 Tax=Lolium multiflorum TaxID=4521 RepID=A0AAD8S0U5_LOLMU|nr:hypothetical protein QYE76_060850 [Lolium multiflorum]
MTGPRRRRLRRCLADRQLPGTGSGRPGKRTPLGLRPCRGEPKPKLARHQLRLCTDGARSSYDPQVTDRRDWANLTTEFIEDIAGRLLSLDVSEYLRFRAVCKPWRALTEDPRDREHGVLDSRFRPCNWFLLSMQVEAPFHLRLQNRVTGVTVRLNHPEFPASHYLSLVHGLLVLCDKATYAVRVLHPLTGALADFPDITDVRDRIGAGPDARVAMDAFRSRFPGLGPEPNAYLATEGYAAGFPAFDTVLTSAGLDESTSPPTLQLCVRDEAWLVLRAKPRDEYWVALYPWASRAGIGLD